MDHTYSQLSKPLVQSQREENLFLKRLIHRRIENKIRVILLLISARASISCDQLNSTTPGTPFSLHVSVCTREILSNVPRHLHRFRVL